MNRKPKRSTFLKIVLVIIFVLNNTFDNYSKKVFAQSNQGYPKIGIFHFNSGDTPAEWYAKFDFIVTSRTSSGFVSSVKAINPNALVLWTIDWNVGAGINSYTPPKEWRVTRSDGTDVMIYGGNRYQADITNLCSTSSSYNNKKYNDYLGPYLAGKVDYNYFDGTSSSGTWTKPRDSDDMDFDGNGVNDFVEHGENWVYNNWLAGIEKAIDNVRSAIGQNEIIFFNPGGMQEYNSSIHSKINGIYAEDTGAMYSYRFFKNTYNQYIRNSKTPHCVLIDAEGSSKDQFNRMRFFLGVTMFGDGYFSFTEQNSSEHHYKSYYDEYELNLGQPTSDAIQLYGTGDNDQGVYVRFFDLGCVIVNIDETGHTVSNSEIDNYPEYNGPYYRFKGGQAPNFNTGGIFTSVSLSGTQLSKGYVGDAILLLKTPTTSITEIIIDSDNDGTSPGSNEAQYIGSWTRTNDVSNAWCLNYRDYRDAYAINYIASGDGSSYAIFAPTIGVAGHYKVYEWHGDVNGLTEATNVPYEIHHASGTARGIINQSANLGKWNYIGTFYFNQGNQKYVKLTNNANGVVVADAIKFVFDQSGESDNIPPNAPSNLRCDSKTEYGFTLSWSPPQQASDGDIASSYEIYRNNTFIGYSVFTTYIDSGLTENTTYSYKVYAVDDYGNVSLSAASGNFTTLTDQISPTVDSVYALTNSIVKIIFSETVEKSSAENINNYSINNDISVSSASLMNDDKTIHLNTNRHEAGVTYNLIINNIKDRATNPNFIAGNTSASYVGVGDPIEISLSADNNYDLYINGVFMGSDGNWKDAETYYYISLQAERNVIAVKCTDNISTGGLVAEITIGTEKYVSDETWKVSTTYQQGWESLVFNDNLWQNATSYGLHGVAQPWAQYGNVTGISQDSGVEWIWSSDNQTEKEVYFRFVIGGDNMDITPPAPPTGLTITR